MANSVLTGNGSNFQRSPEVIDRCDRSKLRYPRLTSAGYMSGNLHFTEMISGVSSRDSLRGDCGATKA